MVNSSPGMLEHLEQQIAVWLVLAGESVARKVEEGMDVSHEARNGMR